MIKGTYFETRCVERGNPRRKIVISPRGRNNARRRRKTSPRVDHAERASLFNCLSFSLWSRQIVSLYRAKWQIPSPTPQFSFLCRSRLNERRFFFLFFYQPRCYQTRKLGLNVLHIYSRRLLKNVYILFNKNVFIFKINVEIKTYDMHFSLTRVTTMQ